LSKTTIVVGLIVLIFIAIFATVIFLDSRQKAASEPPEGVQEFDVSGGVNNHTQDPVSYDQDPPVGGPHNPIWQNQGFYDEPVRNENAVHDMEHGAVWITYSPDLPQDQKDTLKDIVESKDCLLASPYPNLPSDAPVVASAWGKQLRLGSADDPKLQQFVSAYRKGPQTPEPAAGCTGGTGQPTS
jgi:Protein of unknown function (DUF3105)